MSALVSLAVMVVGFVVLALVFTRRSRHRMEGMANLHRPAFVDPTASDLSSAVDELLGTAESLGMSLTTTIGWSHTDPQVEIATSTVRNGVWVCAQLPRPVAAPITFATWKPEAISSFEQAQNARAGVTQAARLDDDRLGRAWLAWTSPEHGPTDVLDADPSVWPVVRAMSSTLVTAPIEADRRPTDSGVEVAPADGFKLGPDISIHFRGRFVLIGPGAKLNLSGRSRPEDLAGAAAFVVTSFTAPPAQA